MGDSIRVLFRWLLYCLIWVYTLYKVKLGQHEDRD